jgi:hypothetical protein
MQQVITRTSEIIFSGGILYVKLFEGANITLKDVEEYYSFTSRITEGKKVPVLVDGTASFTITDEARAYSVEQANKARLATAFITRSAATRMIANLYIQFNKPQTPVRMFTDTESAVKWLKTFR